MKHSLRSYLDADWVRLSTLSGATNYPRRWSSHFNPRFMHITFLRCAQVAYAQGYTRLAKIFSLINFIIFNLEVPARLHIGPGLVIPHPQGIVLGANEIGSNVTIFHQVTLGGKMADFAYEPERRPRVENNVMISVGAKVLGALTLGESCIVGANAVVLEDVPAGATVAGIPAKIIQQAITEKINE